MWRARYFVFVLVLVLVLVLAATGCFAPQFADGAFLCGPAGACPPGTSCDVSSGRCLAHAGTDVDGQNGDANDAGIAADLLHSDLTPGGPEFGFVDLFDPSRFDLRDDEGDLAAPDLAPALDASTPPDLTPPPPYYGSGALGDLDLSSLSGALHCNTETGEIIVDASSVAIVHAGQLGFVHTPQKSGGPAVAMWNFRNLTIPAGVTLVPSSSSASVPVFAATNAMTIAGTIDWSGYGGLGGGHGLVGNSKQSGVASGGGGAFATDGSGGGGGGYATSGAAGNGVGPGAPGSSYGTTDLSIIYFGSGGGGGGNAGGGIGGNGGGALVLLGQTITLSGTLDVSALDGSNGSSGVSGGGGGGSGGSILVSAGSLLLDTGHQLLARAGGSGGAGPTSGFAGGAGAVGRITIDTPTLPVAGGGAPNSSPQLIRFMNAPLTEFPR